MSLFVQDEVIANIEARIAAWTFLPPGNFPDAIIVPSPILTVKTIILTL